MGFTAPKDMRIATLSIGYADGFDHRLSMGGQVTSMDIAESWVVCMDLCMIDVTMFLVRKAMRWKSLERTYGWKRRLNV